MSPSSTVGSDDSLRICAAAAGSTGGWYFGDSKRATSCRPSTSGSMRIISCRETTARPEP